MKCRSTSFKSALFGLLFTGLPGLAVADLTVFAAASLKEALDEVAQTFEAETDVRVAVSLSLIHI